MQEKPFERIITASATEGHVSALVMDEFHHFEVNILHDDRFVTDISGIGHRVPWTTCPGAIKQLSVFVGVALSPTLVGATHGIDASEQCTHLLDLAKLAVAHATRGGTRLFHVVVSPAAAHEDCTAEIWCNGGRALAWQVSGDQIVGSGPFSGHHLGGRAVWPDGAAFDRDTLEAAVILRRGVRMFRGRRQYRPDMVRATDLPFLAGACFTFHRDRIDDALSTTADMTTRA
jgi:hypothetical protein